MRTVQRTPDRALLRDAAAIAAAMVAVGASFGAIAIAYGLPTWVPFLMSTAVFAGGAQFLAVGLIAANPIAAVFAGLLLNARHLPFGLAVSETIGPRWRDRLIGSHLMTDEVVAFTLAEKDPVRRRRTYWLIGFTLFTSWNVGTALGVLLGGAASDPSVFGLDAAFPAGLLALILPSLRDRDTRLVALAGAAIAVLLTPVLPAGLPVLCALLGLAVLILPRRPKPEEPSGGTHVSSRQGVESTSAAPGVGDEHSAPGIPGVAEQSSDRSPSEPGARSSSAGSSTSGSAGSSGSSAGSTGSTGIAGSGTGNGTGAGEESPC